MYSPSRNCTTVPTPLSFGLVESGLAQLVHKLEGRVRKLERRLKRMRGYGPGHARGGETALHRIRTFLLSAVHTDKQSVENKELAAVPVCRTTRSTPAEMPPIVKGRGAP